MALLQLMNFGSRCTVINCWYQWTKECLVNQGRSVLWVVISDPRHTEDSIWRRKDGHNIFVIMKTTFLPVVEYSSTRWYHQCVTVNHVPMYMLLNSHCGDNQRVHYFHEYIYIYIYHSHLALVRRTVEQCVMDHLWPLNNKKDQELIKDRFPD